MSESPLHFARQLRWWWIVWGSMLAGWIAAFAIPWTEWSPPAWHEVLDWRADFSLSAYAIVLFPLCLVLRSGLLLHRRDVLRNFVRKLSSFCFPDEVKTRDFQAVDWCLSLGVSTLSLLMSWQAGQTLRNLPPAYHDEYSYLFQAKTLSAGRFSFPSHPTVAAVFDQMHIVNQGRFASRYYPGTGIWIAPWLAMGHPFWGHWLAGAWTTFFAFWTVRYLSGTGTALIAGLLIALSPGLALFSNLLLAHHPTLAGISFFLFYFTKWSHTPRSGYLILAGIGLGFSVLCRPATAVGIGLPYACWFLYWCWINRANRNTHWLRHGVCLFLPLLITFLVMIAYHQDITGRWLQSPYQLYTDTYSPRHVYGFYNVTRGTKALSNRSLPAVTRNYDAWAEELTPEMATRHILTRLVTSWRWSLGTIPILWVMLASLCSGNSCPAGWKLLFCAIVSLHAIHVPYWFDGIMHWHYVFESSVLWLMLVAGATGYMVKQSLIVDRPWLVIWLGLLLTGSAITNWVSCPPFWNTRLEVALLEIRFPKVIYAGFQQLLKRQVTELPALVLVIPDPADRHMDLVTNDPSLDSPILIGRLVETELPLKRIAQEFPDRHIYIYDAKTRRLTSYYGG